MRFRAFRVQKAGNSIAEYEDAYAPKRDGDYEGRTMGFALGDGAASSAFASMWANMLVKTWVKKPVTYRVGLKRKSERLAKLHGERILTREIPWYAEELVRNGAFSTFLGVRFGRTPWMGCRWESLAVGDTCLFQMRDNRVIATFPISDVSEFRKSPALLCSKPKWNGRVWTRVKRKWGRALRGDYFLLMTDALAEWFMLKYEESSWDLLQDISSGRKGGKSRFEDLVSQLRMRNEIRNDDTTLLMIEVMEDE